MSTPTENLRKFRGSTSPGATHRVVFGRSCKDLADRSLVIALRPPRRHESAWSAATFYGIGSAVARIVDVARVTIDENMIPIGPVVRVACELLALDPLYVANEGRFVAFVPAREAERTMNLLRRHERRATRLSPAT